MEYKPTESILKELSTSYVYLLVGEKKGSSANFVFKDTHREKALSNKTPALTKNANKGIWVVGTTHQLFIRGS